MTTEPTPTLTTDAFLADLTARRGGRVPARTRIGLHKISDAGDKIPAKKVEAARVFFADFGAKNGIYALDDDVRWTLRDGNHDRAHEKIEATIKRLPDAALIEMAAHVAILVMVEKSSRATGIWFAVAGICPMSEETARWNARSHAAYRMIEEGVQHEIARRIVTAEKTIRTLRRAAKATAKVAASVTSRKAR